MPIFSSFTPNKEELSPPYTKVNRNYFLQIKCTKFEALFCKIRMSGFFCIALLEFKVSLVQTGCRRKEIEGIFHFQDH